MQQTSQVRTLPLCRLALQNRHRQS